MMLLLYSGTDVKTPVPVGDFWRRERERDSRAFFNFCAARKYSSGWIGQVILIGWKCSATLTVKLNYVFFLLQRNYLLSSSLSWLTDSTDFIECILLSHRLSLSKICKKQMNLNFRSLTNTGVFLCRKESTVVFSLWVTFFLSRSA